MSDASHTLRGSSTALQGNLRVMAGSVVFGSTTVDLGTLDAGDVVIQAWAEVTTVFNAATTNVITLGNGVTADKFLAAADVTEGSTGVTPTGGKGPFTAETVAGTLRATYAQTGTAATTGAAKVYAIVSSAAI
jgi:hypothetical protein